MQLYDLPDPKGHFGPYGGVFVAETLSQALEELNAAYDACRRDPEFAAELAYELKHYVGRPSPIYHAKRLSDHLGGAQIFLKREDLNHTGAHKINNTIGQAPKPAPECTAWPRQPSPRATAWSAWCTWARKTPSARCRTSIE